MMNAVTGADASKVCTGPAERQRVSVQQETGTRAWRGGSRWCRQGRCTVAHEAGRQQECPARLRLAAQHVLVCLQRPRQAQGTGPSRHGKVPGGLEVKCHFHPVMAPATQSHASLTFATKVKELPACRRALTSGTCRMKAVTMPKLLPPPPQEAQSRSELYVLLAVTMLPLVSTISMPTRLSHTKPCSRLHLP